MCPLWWRNVSCSPRLRAYGCRIFQYCDIYLGVTTCSAEEVSRATAADPQLVVRTWRRVMTTTMMALAAPTETLPTTTTTQVRHDLNLVTLKDMGDSSALIAQNSLFLSCRRHHRRRPVAHRSVTCWFSGPSSSPAVGARCWCPCVPTTPL